MRNFLRNFEQFLICLDQLIFCIFGLIYSIFKHDYRCYADMTISANAWRVEQKGYWYGKMLRRVIDFMFLPFGKNHCFEAYQSELNRSHLPKD